MFHIYYGYWDYWNLNSKVTFDGEAKLITVNPGVTTLDIRADVYSRWVDWRALYGNSIWEQAMRYSGLDPIPGGQTGDIYFLYNGWKLIIDFNVVKVTGVLYSDNFSTPYYSSTLLPLYAATVSALVNTVTVTTNVITGDISSVPTAQEISNQVVADIQVPTASQNAIAVWQNATATGLIADIDFIRAIEGGKWDIVNNQMIFYAEDNTTEVARFNLFKADNTPTIDNPMKRVRV